jgi:hypothetical protein
MRKTWFPTTAVALALVAAGAARADDNADTRAVIEKAIKAAGGADKLAEKAATFKLKGKFYGMGEGIDFTGDYSIQPPDKFRVQMEIDVNGMKLAFTQVVDGDKGWRKIGDMGTTDLDKDELAEVHEEMYAGRVETLVALVKDKGFGLAPLGEVKVGEQAAVGVRVSHKGHRDINLFFDQKTGLILKTERVVKDQMAGGKEVTQETVLGDYKDVGGAQHPMKLVIKREGKPYVEGEVSDYETKDKIEDAVFAKP